MKVRILKALGMAAALLLNVACGAQTNTNVWSNSDYGYSGSAPSVKTANGISILN